MKIQVGNFGAVFGIDHFKYRHQERIRGLSSISVPNFATVATVQFYGAP